MNRVSVYLTRIGVIVLAYFMACVMAAFFFFIAAFASAESPLLHVIAAVPVAAFASPLLAVAFAVFAAPYASAAALFLELLGWKHWCFYATAAFAIGILIAYSNWSNLPIPEGTEWPDPPIRSAIEFWLIVSSATFGGLIYWAIAGRSAGYWKVRDASSVTAQSTLLSILFSSLVVLAVVWMLFNIVLTNLNDPSSRL